MNRKLRRGFTTGACAAAAAKSAAIMLFSRERLGEAEVILPTGEKASFRLYDAEVNRNEARCCVVKDAGDDPDVTNGAKICASVARGKGMELRGGEGVGVVTKEGLQVSVGMPAINPVPREMIIREVSQVLPRGEGAVVTISVPSGKALAKRTMNEKLGILDGISILGTTGIVEPMSVEALKASLIPQIDVAIARGYDEVVLTPGRMGERRAVERGIARDAVILTSNYIGFILGKCAEKGVRRALLFGHLGKLTKVAMGAANTHSSLGNSGIEIIAAHARAMGAGEKAVASVLRANTTEEALKILRENSSIHVFDSIAKEAGIKARDFAGGALDVGVVLMSMGGEIVGRHNLGGSRWAKYLS
jgi:cobalt-precorrin-5B (C1)-methyltransferase